MAYKSWFERSVTASIRDGWVQCEPWAGTVGKRYKAIEAVCKKIDWDTLEVLPTVTFFAPSLDHAGEVMTRPAEGSVFVYLAPTLEFNSQRDVNFTVAHELAHVALRHYDPANAETKVQADRHEERPGELAADALAQSWGFSKRSRGKNGFIKWMDKASETT